MKNIFALLILFCFFSCKTTQKAAARLDKTAWISGALNCQENTNPPIQVLRYNDNTFILRENKCIHYEAPFLFLFLGNKKALLMDTGATEDENKFPLYKTIRRLLDEWEKRTQHPVELIVAHTHAHGDHTAGDNQFKNKAGITVLGLDVTDVASFFKINNWPLQNGRLDLGDRTIDIIPLPGHQKASIAVYDYNTKLLLSGDSFYPGRLYINDWPAFALSTQRLVNFTSAHPVSRILGNHIEMTNTPGKDYPAGTTYQPAEHILPLRVKDLQELNQALKAAGNTPQYEIHKRFIIYPK